MNVISLMTCSARNVAVMVAMLSKTVLLAQPALLLPLNFTNVNVEKCRYHSNI